MAVLQSWKMNTEMYEFGWQADNDVSNEDAVSQSVVVNSFERLSNNIQFTFACAR